MTSIPSDTASPETLLEHADWIRTLARKLVGDAVRADDLAQETWVRMLARPPQQDRPLRAWIATVMRHLARSEHRRDRRRSSREAAVAHPDRDPSDPLARVACQRDVVDAVLALDEPYRSAIVLRYFESLPPRRIAARLGVPVTTVKTRLARGLAQLRQRLDKSEDGRSWLLALLPLVHRPIGAAPMGLTTGVIAMNGKLVASLLAAVLVVAGFTWFSWDDGSAAVPTAGADDQGAEVASATTGGGESADVRVDRVPPIERTEIATGQSATSDAGTSGAERLVRGRVIDVQGLPVPRVEVGFVADPTDPEHRTVPANEQGRFEIAAREGRGNLAAFDDRYATVLTARAVPAAGIDPVIVVAPRVVLRGHVVDAQGGSIPDAHAVLRLPRDFRGRLGTVLDHSTAARWEARSDDEGRLEFKDLPAVDGAVLIVRADGFEPHEEASPSASREDWLAVLELPDPNGARLRGVVVDAAGARVSDALVSMGVDTVRSDERGRFEFVLDAEKTFNAFASRFVEVDTARLVAIKPGYLPGELLAPSKGEDGRPQWPKRVTLRLGAEPLSIQGTVVDADGQPREGVTVWVADPTFFGGLGDPATQRFPQLTHVENVLGGAAPGWHSVRTAEDGSFELDGLLDRDYVVRAMDEATLLRQEREVHAGRSDVRIRLAISETNAYARLRGRVVGFDGAPIRNVMVTPMCDSFRTRLMGRVIGTNHSTTEGVRTDADGRFELRRVPRDFVYLRLDGEDTVPLEWGRRVEGGLGHLVGENPLEVEVTLGRRCHFQVVLDDPNEADQIGVLDAQGEVLQVSEFLGRGRRESRRQPLNEGKSNQLGVGDNGVTLVLYRDGEEVRRASLRLSVAERTVVRL